MDRPLPDVESIARERSEQRGVVAGELLCIDSREAPRCRRARTVRCGGGSSPSTAPQSACAASESGPKILSRRQRELGALPIEFAASRPRSERAHRHPGCTKSPVTFGCSSSVDAVRSHSRPFVDAAVRTKAAVGREQSVRQAARARSRSSPTPTCDRHQTDVDGAKHSRHRQHRAAPVDVVVVVDRAEQSAESRDRRRAAVRKSFVDASARSARSAVRRRAVVDTTRTRRPAPSARSTPSRRSRRRVNPGATISKIDRRRDAGEQPLRRD